jgi:hypothetical protein
VEKPPSAQVYSENIVGYATKDLNASQFFMYGMNFEKELGGDKVIGDLIPSVGWNSDVDQIQIANVNPETGIINFDIYTYYDYDPNWGGAANSEGWYDIEYNKVDKTLSLSAGLGFWIYTATDQ